MRLFTDSLCLCARCYRGMVVARTRLPCGV
nr:MAG TPA: hypothetical protein [Caudoviricetes sp.]